MVAPVVAAVANLIRTALFRVATVGARWRSAAVVGKVETIARKAGLLIVSSFRDRLGQNWVFRGLARYSKRNGGSPDDLHRKSVGLAAYIASTSRLASSVNTVSKWTVGFGQGGVVDYAKLYVVYGEIWPRVFSWLSTYSAASAALVSEVGTGAHDGVVSEIGNSIKALSNHYGDAEFQGMMHAVADIVDFDPDAYAKADVSPAAAYASDIVSLAAYALDIASSGERVDVVDLLVHAADMA